MKQYSLTREHVDSLGKKLQDSGYTAKNTSGYSRFYKKNGDSVFITDSLNIIRATKGTKGHEIINEVFGNPNGKEPVGEDKRMSSWFFNGYLGKDGTIIDDTKFRVSCDPPDDFNLHFFGFFGPDCSVNIQDGVLGYSYIYMDSPRPLSAEDFRHVSPMSKEWKPFWSLLNKIRIWEWRERYENHDILDGTQWNLRLQVGNRVIKTSGSNDYPPQFDRLTRWLSRMLGGVTIA